MSNNTVDPIDTLNPLTLNPKPQTPNPKPSTLNPKPSSGGAFGKPLLAEHPEAAGG